MCLTTHVLLRSGGTEVRFKQESGMDGVKRTGRLYPLLLSAVFMCSSVFSACADASGSRTSSTAAAGPVTETLSSAAAGSEAVTSSAVAGQESVLSASEKSESVSPDSETAADGSEVDGYMFTWSGGSGRAVITCQSVSEQNGQLYATIHFSRANGGTSAYTQVQSLGQTVSGDNTFTIPVNRDANTTIQALTTAMSEPHWITYVLYIGRNSGAGSAGLSGTELDESAPEIAGLTAEEAVDVRYSDKLRIFAYEDDIYLIEVDMVKDTARVSDARDDSEPTSSQKDAEEPAERAGDEQDAGGTSSAVMYLKNVVNYLVVPEDYDVPAGLEKKAVIIRRPADRIFITSPAALEIMTKLGRAEDILAVGMDADEISDETVKAALEKSDGDEGKIYQAGTFSDWDLKTLILQKADLAIESSEILPENTEDAEEDMQTFKKIVSDAGQMDMPVFVDRSADETNDSARAEWYRVYGIISGAEDTGEELYQEAVGEQ